MSPQSLRSMLCWNLLFLYSASHAAYTYGRESSRERLSINDGWKFWRSETNPDGLIYDHRPDPFNETTILKPWILPSANDFINDPADWYERPAGNPGGNVTYVQSTYDDSSWEDVNVPHDWAIKGPFYEGQTPVVGGSMGKLPVQGVGWYRRKLEVSSADLTKTIFLEIDGAMAYPMVWLNGHFVGGWAYPYNSFRLDLSPYLRAGRENQLAIRLDNPNNSARWYPGGGIYRNVWISKTNKLHVGQWGTFITAKAVSADSATLDLQVQVENKGNTSGIVDVITDVYLLDSRTGQAGEKVITFPKQPLSVTAGQKQSINSSVTISKPQLWHPSSEPGQIASMYVAITRILTNRQEVDTYSTPFGVRSLVYSPDNGLLVNGKRVEVQGVNQHHDLGAIGAAFNVRAATRQLEILQEMGCNAIRMSHNPPAPELLDLTDRMGFLVMDEIFDVWQRNKTTNDFHLIFDDWHEADLRTMLRRDRNHPSIVAWSYGNEVGEQYTDVEGAAISSSLRAIVHEEDGTRLSTASINYATPDMPFPAVLDIISLNYQGAGIRNTNPYSNLSGIRRDPMYPYYHGNFTDKMIWSSESASAVSSRGSYIFPVVNDTSAPANDTSGLDSAALEASGYELYSANFGSSPDKVFASQDANLYVAGEFVWTGWDYLGEPTPFDARSSYSGIVDLAGFKKDRFYLYQARWRPDFKMAHILPHWTWPDRVGLVTPVHVFSSGDEAELFVNGASQGKLIRGESEYRFRWDDVVYEAGEVTVQTWKNGEPWANATVVTSGEAASLRITADKDNIQGNGLDLSFLTVEVVDDTGVLISEADVEITFSAESPAEIVATDNGFPGDMVSFGSLKRKTFNGLALGIVKAEAGSSGPVTISVSADGIRSASVVVDIAN